MAAKATRFCLRTLRTKPLRVVGVDLWGCSRRAATEEDEDVEVGEEIEDENVEAWRVVEEVEEGARRRGRRKARPRANNWLIASHRKWRWKWKYSTRTPPGSAREEQYV